ncbi:hypothetical protein GALMADRAFT_85228 [Galerina marginata CBS 339.88]|uniref:BTB domain-containing protein n=1 Tax=Galerina marginata (strain CBS 339.88) TaxID=685588 RepID=A0A067TS29_GALM3|nr:hypothetical protein GALMADRAFT_85228 [Galerina marginata CBS 339.88]
MEAVTVQSNSNPPNTKRKRRPRTESDDEGNVEEPLKSAAYWFEDGNVMLQAGKTQFRVHCSILSRHSQVFQDMFSFPQPKNETLFEGCPLVHVTDAPKDWENIFSILYDYNASYASTSIFALPLLASMLRIGKEYQFDNLQSLALERIRKELPDSLDAWDVKNELEKGSGLIVNSDCEIDIINVLLETGFKTLLPMAYFICVASLTSLHMFEGLPRGDGTISRLSTESIKELMIGREAISTAIMSHEFPWTTSSRSQSAIPTPGCRTKPKCESHRSTVLAKLVPGPNPYQALIFRVESIVSKRYCDSCAAEIRKIYQAGRKIIWDQLPSYFGLPKWADLKDV